LYWAWLSRHRKNSGRRCVSRELRDLIFRMVAENLTWGAPRIHGELKMLGFDISERTVLRWMRNAPRNPEPAKQWIAFLNNHREAIAAMDFFTVPTLTFGVLHCFFVIAHNQRRISALWRDEASDGCMDFPAVVRVVSLQFGPLLPDLRSS
jgi:putative transposase